ALQLSEPDREQPGADGVVEEIWFGMEARIFQRAGDERRVDHRDPAQDSGPPALFPRLGYWGHGRLSVTGAALVLALADAPIVPGRWWSPPWNTLVDTLAAGARERGRELRADRYAGAKSLRASRRRLREVMPSFANTLWRWYSAVRELMKS